jgi:hypothetical protein
MGTIQVSEDLLTKLLTSVEALLDVVLFIPQVVRDRYLPVDRQYKDPVLVPLGGYFLLRQVSTEKLELKPCAIKTRLAFGSQIKPPGIFTNLQTDSI